MTTREWLSPKEIAARAGFHVDTIYDWAKMPNFPGLLRPRIRGRMRIDWTEFKEWNSNRINTEPKNDQGHHEKD